MRVAMLTDFPSPGDAPQGGVEVVARNLALAIGRRGDVELHVVTSREDVYRAYLAVLPDCVTVHYLPRLARLELPTLFFHERLMLRRLLSRLQPEVVHVQGLGRYAYACGALGYPYVLTVHGIASIEQQILSSRSFGSRLRLPLVRFVEAASIRRAEAVIANSRYILERLPSTHRARTILIPNPVDPLFFAPHSGASHPGRITWVGRLVRLKAVHVLVRLLPAVRRECPAASLRVVGPPVDPAYSAELRELASRTSPHGCVEFVGARRGSELRAEYAAAAVVALSSLQENAPMAIAEAMAVGRPVVAPRVGGVAELVADGLTGTLCASNDFDGLARALSQILLDEGRRHQMGAMARAIAESRFNVERIAERHCEVYRSLVLTPLSGRRAADRPGRRPVFDSDY